jgi:hypothetical protein
LFPGLFFEGDNMVHWQLELGQILGMLFTEGKISLAEAWNLVNSCEQPIDEERMEQDTKRRMRAQK